MRKTVTIPRDLFLELKDFKMETRQKLLYYVLDNLFDGKITTNEIPEEIRDAYIGFKYEFGKIQKQYDNGKKSVQKNTKQKNTGLFCPFDDTQKDPTSTQPNPYDYDYNIKNNNKLTNIINIYINNQSVSQLNKYKYINNNLPFGKLIIMVGQVQKICGEENFEKIIKAVEKVAKLQSIKVGGLVKSPGEVLDKIVGLLLTEGAGEQIKIKLDNLSQTTGITSPTSYLIASLYNLAIDFEKESKHIVSQFPLKQTKNQNSDALRQRTYTKEELESLYDDLDDIEI